MEHFQISETDLWVYISKTADQQRIQNIEKWIESDDFDEELFSKLTNIYTTTKTKKTSVESAKKDFFNRVPVQPKHSIWRDFYKYAAVLVLIFTVGYTYQQVVLDANQIIVQTTFGEQKQIDLTDGSTVWLNASSKLSYNSDSPRTLFLVGEAFFEVAKDKLHPFTVTTPDHIIVRALGTSFNVKSYIESNTTETKLLTGVVEVTSGNPLIKKVIMHPNDVVTFFRGCNELVKSKIIGVESSIGWKEGKIQFSNKKFSDIATDLSNQFNLKISFDNEEIENSKFTGSFDNTTPLTTILEILKISKPFEFYQTKDNVWIIK